jgi:hypothetical protein
MNTTHTSDAHGRWRSASRGIAEGMHRPGLDPDQTPSMGTTSTTSRTPGRGVRRGLITLVLALVALLSPLSAPAAHAAPTLTASENPVFIPYSKDTKNINLTWSLEPWQLLATLTVTESGTPAPVIDKTVGQTPPPGGEPLTVTYGKTYTAELKDVITQQPLVAPLTITTDRLDIKIDMGCLVDCITKVDPDEHGGWAQFTIDTNRKTMMTLEASKTKPNANGTWTTTKDVAASTATILPTQSWTAPLPDLDSNTTYYYVVRAHDDNGNEWVETGSFKTLTRRVDVTLAEIEMIDDSDDLGDCDCFFWFNAGDETPKPWGDFQHQKSIASGTTVHPNVAFTINNAPSEIRIRALGYDDDSAFGSLCSEPTGYLPYTGNATWIATSGMADDCQQLTGDQVTVSVSHQGQPAAPDAVDEQFTEKFTISAGLGPLAYKVHGTYKVTYA